jgi:hypothetical protein
MEQKSCRDRRPCQTKVQALSGILGYKESTLVWSVPPTKKTWWELDWNSKLNTTQKPWFYMYHYSVKKWCCSAQNWTTRCRRSLGLQVISGNSVSSHRGFAWDVHRAMGAKSTMTCHIEHYSIIMFSYYTWLYMYIYIHIHHYVSSVAIHGLSISGHLKIWFTIPSHDFNCSPSKSPEIRQISRVWDTPKVAC